jgi:hypothetical protein
MSPAVAVRAQNADIPILDPQQILSPSVQNVSQLPVININNETRTFYYFSPETDTWITLDYPDGLDEIRYANNVRSRSDGTFLFNRYGFFTASPNTADTTWIFDPTQGEFVRHSSVCDGWAQALPGEGEWIIIEDEQASRLCNTETGTTSPPIPSPRDDGFCYPEFGLPIVTSPRDNYILFFCGDGIQTFSAFSYNVDEQTFLNLGSGAVSWNENVKVIHWLNNNEAIVQVFFSPQPPSTDYYVANITRNDSLEFIAGDTYKGPFYYNDPPRLEWMPCEFSSCGPNPDFSRLHVYNFTTRELTLLPRLERVFGASALIPDGSDDRLYNQWCKLKSS